MKYVANINFKTTISLMAVVCIWGSVWPIYKYALQFTPPVLFSGMRSTMAGVLFAIILIPQWKQIKWKENWSIYVISSIFNVILFFGVQSVGLQYLPAGLYSVIVYFQPVLVVILAWFLFKEGLNRNKIIGVLLGFLGVVMVSLDGISGKIAPIGFVLALITAIGWAIGTVYVKLKSSVVHGLWLVALQNLIGGLCMLLYGLGVEDVRAIDWNLSFISCLVYGAIFGVALAHVLYYQLMAKKEAGKVSSFTFLVPLIAVLLGTIFLGEPLTISLFIGMALILLSIYLINRRPNEIVVKENLDLLKTNQVEIK